MDYFWQQILTFSDVRSIGLFAQTSKNSKKLAEEAIKEKIRTYKDNIFYTYRYHDKLAKKYFRDESTAIKAARIISNKENLTIIKAIYCDTHHKQTKKVISNVSPNWQNCMYSFTSYFLRPIFEYQLLNKQAILPIAEIKLSDFYYDLNKGFFYPAKKEIKFYNPKLLEVIAEKELLQLKI